MEAVRQLVRLSAAAALLLSTSVIVVATAERMPYIRPQDLPVKDPNAWMSIDKNVEFIPVDPNGSNVFHPPQQPLLRNLGDNGDDDGVNKEALYQQEVVSKVYSVQPFVEGMEEYDEYQQAWRLLGFMIDCHSYDADYDDEGGSGDELTGEGCHRFVLWAAYVDLNYEGGGIGEYQFYDRKNKKWDDSTCKYAAKYGNGNGSGRCAKMDCHLEDTHFSLLGFFKHRVIDDWMEQLFKHEGICVWTDEEYAFMKNARKGWPSGCSTSSSTYTDDDGNVYPIYYDMKPANGGAITLGLYTDSHCVIEYKSKGSDDPITPQNVLGNVFANAGSGDRDHNDNNGNYDFSSWSLTKALSYWDSAFDIFTICQPCVAYDLNNYDGSAYANNDDDRGGGGQQGDPFDCYDDADYTNVNQCMKFMAKTTMQTATFRDLQLARTQGTVVKSPLAGYKQDRKPFYRKQTFNTFKRYVFFVVSMVMLFNSAKYFWRVKKERKYQPHLAFFKEPLVEMS